MQRNKDYQLDDVIFEIVVWLFVIVIIYQDIEGTFWLQYILNNDSQPWSNLGSYDEGSCYYYQCFSSIVRVHYFKATDSGGSVTWSN